MRRYILELDSLSDLSSALVAYELGVTLDCLKEDLKYAKKRTTKGGGVFHEDPKQDAAEIKRNIEAIKLVLQYYGEEP